MRDFSISLSFQLGHSYIIFLEVGIEHLLTSFAHSVIDITLVTSAFSEKEPKDDNANSCQDTEEKHVKQGLGLIIYQFIVFTITLL
jgi:hypothetical protein